MQSCQVQMIKNLEVVGAFSAKKNFPDKIIFDDVPPPPRRQKHFGQCTILGVRKFFGHTKIFRDIIQIFKISQNNTISHKIDRICPIFLYYKPILPDCEANIVRLALFAQQTWGWGGANPCIKDHFNGIRKIFKTNRETWRSARKPGDSRVNRETWQL